MSEPERPPDDQPPGLLRTTATWAAATLATGGIVFLAIIALTHGVTAYTVTNYVIWLAVIVWLLWLTLTRVDRKEQIDQAVDDADAAVRIADALRQQLEDADPPSAGRHAQGRPRT